MKSLSRDILITLIVKFTLLIALWWICFKDIERPPKDMPKWLLGANHVATTPMHIKQIN